MLAIPTAHLSSYLHASFTPSTIPHNISCITLLTGPRPSLLPFNLSYHLLTLTDKHILHLRQILDIAAGISPPAAVSALLYPTPSGGHRDFWLHKQAIINVPSQIINNLLKNYFRLPLRATFGFLHRLTAANLCDFSHSSRFLAFSEGYQDLVVLTSVLVAYRPLSACAQA